jgi:DNA repair protein SbcC/Rad50
MLITRVELEKIKNYEAGSFEFGPGVTAISGPNGAGKTTILEAISWALFDQLAYKKEDFLKRGAKKGSVRVTFVSALDGREYTVYRDTGTGYYIYDPVTKLRLVEQKNQVAVWIRQHLGVEPGADLKSLFTSTIGVPQGTFTVDFADQPSRRKIGFDKVLRVDEYQRSSEELKALIRLVESKDVELREQIAALGVEVASLDGLIEERDAIEKSIDDLRRDLDSTEREREHARTELQRLDGLQRLIEQTSRDIATLQSRSEEIKRRRIALGEDVEKARRASEIVQATAAGFDAYNEANTRCAALEIQATRRDLLKREFSEKERELYRIETSAQALAEKLGQIDADRKEIDALAPLAREQERLEARAAELQTAIAELTVVAEQVKIAERELDSSRAEYLDISKRIKEAEKLRETAEHAPELEEERRTLEAESREMRVALERVSERKKELKRARNNIAKISAEIETLEREMSAALPADKAAYELAELETLDQATMEEIATLRASVEREKKILSQVKGGLCPLLSEKCLNMKEGQGLDQYFRVQIGSESGRLTEAERRRKEIQRKLVDAKVMLKASFALETHRVHYSRYVQDLEIERATAAKLEADIGGASASEQGLRLSEARLDRLERELQSAREARVKYESLGLLRDRMARLTTEGTERKKAIEDLKKRIAAIDEFKEELGRLAERLRTIDDARGRARLLRAGLEKERELKESLALLETQQQTLSRAIEELTVQLEASRDLDQQIVTEREQRARSENDHRAFMENQPVAALLEAREAELNEVSSEHQKAISQLDAWTIEINQARSEYDPERHKSVAARLEQLHERVATLNSELNAALTRVKELVAEIDSLREARDRLKRLEAARDRYNQILTLSDFIRDVLKRAVPYITEAHLQTISIEANQLYRDITGNPMVSLRWDPGYEIILEEDGHERAFASLSGGEQMAAALAVRLALLKELSDMRIAFFDEPTTNMDEERRRNLAQQIGRIKDFDQLFVISHDDAFEGFTDQVVTVRGQMEGV